MTIVELIGLLAKLIMELVGAQGDEVKEEEALMKGQEELKRFLDARKFSAELAKDTSEKVG